MVRYAQRGYTQQLIVKLPISCLADLCLPYRVSKAALNLAQSVYFGTRKRVASNATGTMHEQVVLNHAIDFLWRRERDSNPR